MADATDAVWIYDMRTGAPAYGKTRPINAGDFADFVTVFGDLLDGSEPEDMGEEGRFRRFTRAEIKARGDSLDITWLKDTSANLDNGLTNPEEIASAIEGHLAAALVEVQALLEEMEGEPPEGMLEEVVA